MILYLIRHGKDDDNIRGGWGRHSLSNESKTKKTPIREGWGIKHVGIALSSQAVTRQVFSTLMSLTSVFGMGTGGSSSPVTPTLH